MKRLFAALAIGLTLGFALLGVGFEPVTGRTTPSTPAPPRSSPTSQISTPQHGGPAQRPAHQYAGLNVRLNQNVIDGVPTVVCTTDSQLFEVLTNAVAAWNQALPNLAFGANGDQTPLVLHQTPSGGRPTNCNAAEVNVVAVQQAACDVSSARACYASTKQSHPPRKLFTTPMNDNRQDNSAHSTIYFQRPSSITFSTALHELGHVLGLSDYRENSSNDDGDQGCMRLHGDLPGIPDVDPLNNHFTLMRNQQSADCWSEGVITGRDLRDFYEAYHVGSILHVDLQGPVTLSGGTLSATLSWGAGITASHNASHVVIFRQAAGSTSWDMVGSMPMWPRMTTMGLTDRSGLANRYKVVGVTRGDIRRQGDFDETVTIGGVTYVEGDPTIIAGIAVWDGSGLRQAMLSASVSPRYCFTGGSLAVSLTPVNTGAVSVRGADGATDRASPYNAGCGSVVGERSFTVTATHTINLPVNVHAQPTWLNLSDVWIQEASGFTVSQGSQDDEVSVACRRGTAGTVHWTTAGGAAPVGVWLTPLDSWMPQAHWAAGYAQSLATAACPATGSGFVAQGLGLIALGADGGGVEARGQDIQRIAAGAPAMPTGFTVLQSTQRQFEISWSAVAGATGYDAKVREEGEVRQIGGRATTRAWVWAPEAGKRETIFLRSRNSQGDTSAWTRTRGRSQDPTLNEPTSVRFSDVTSTSAVLRWAPTLDAHFYEVWHSGWFTTEVTTANTYQFTDLQPDTEYKLSVRGRRTHTETSSWVTVSITTLP